jgi:copper(I)-binding protein
LTAVGYVALKSTGNVPDLTGGSLAAVGRTEVHETSMDDGAMKIRPLGIEIKLGNTAGSVADHMHMDDVNMR